MVQELLLVPKTYANTVLELAHTHLFETYLGDTIMNRFSWPGIVWREDVYYQICPECQQTAPKTHYRNPLVLLPIIETLFGRIAMDLVGPLVEAIRGHQYILVIMDYATKYLEAISLCTLAMK